MLSDTCVYINLPENRVCMASRLQVLSDSVFRRVVPQSTVLVLFVEFSIFWFVRQFFLYYPKFGASLVFGFICWIFHLLIELVGKSSRIALRHALIQSFNQESQGIALHICMPCWAVLINGQFMVL
jgi:hypothetical protein